MGTLLELQNRSNSWLSSVLSTVSSRQETYQGSNGRYWQGLRTHSMVPEHTSAVDGDIAPDELDVAPHYQLDTWEDMFPEFAIVLPVSLTVDTYHGPSGQGWVITIEAVYEGVMYARNINVGPETHRDQDWHPVYYEEPPF